MLVHQMQNLDFLFLFHWEYVGFAKKYPQVLHVNLERKSQSRNFLGVQGLLWEHHGSTHHTAAFGVTV